MKQISAAQFEADCLEIIEQIQKTGEPVTVTSDSKPFVQVIPTKKKKAPFTGRMKNTTKITGNIVDFSGWETT